MIKVHIETDNRYAGKTMTIIAKRADGTHRASPFNIDFVPHQPGEFAEPCFVFGDDDELLKALAQGLAEAGYLPDVVMDKNKELEATKYHLEDMRGLVFNGYAERTKKGIKKTAKGIGS